MTRKEMEPFLLVLISLSASFLPTSLAASVPGQDQESCGRFLVCDLRTEYCRKDVMSCESCAVDCDSDLIAGHPGEQATCYTECAVYYSLKKQSATPSTPLIITSPPSTPVITSPTSTPVITSPTSTPGEVGSKSPVHVMKVVCFVLIPVIVILVAVVVGVCCYRRRSKTNTGVNHPGRGFIAQDQGDLAGGEEVPLQAIRHRDGEVTQEISQSTSSRTDGESDTGLSRGTMVERDETRV